MPSVESKQIVAGMILALGLAISNVQAQGPPGMPPMGGPGGPGGPSLVMDELVQDDLGLSDKQKAQLKKIEVSTRQKMRANFEGARENGVEPQEMMEAMQGIGRDHTSAVNKVLDKNQKARLGQLELQREGLLAVAKPDIAAKIKLTAPQTKKIKTILAEFRGARFQGIMPTPDGDPPADAPRDKTAKTKGRRPPTVQADDGENMGGQGPGGNLPYIGGGFFEGGMPDFNSEEFQAQFAKMREAEKKNKDAAIAKIGEILTKEQAEAFDKLVGKPFDFSKLTPGKPPGAEEPKAEGDTPKADMPAAKAQPKSKTGKTPKR